MRDFEDDLREVFTARMKGSGEFCSEVWSSLANIVWENKDGAEFAASFRYAGGLIADIIGEGDYMDWYCSGDYAVVSQEISSGMLTLGWTPHEYD